MRKQKAPAPIDSGIKTPKMIKIATPNSHKTQPLSQPTNSTHNEIFDPESSSLDQLSQIWNRAKNNQIPVSQDQVQIADMKRQLAQANLENEQLQKRINMGKKKRATSQKHLEDYCKMRDTVIDQQNRATNLMSMIGEHTNAIINIQEHCEEDRRHLAEVYDTVASEQQEMIENLTKQLKEHVSEKKKELENQLESKCNELLTLRTACEHLDKKKEEKIQFDNEIYNEFKVYEVSVDENEKKYSDQSAQISKTTKEYESNLDIEQQAIHKLEAEINEISPKWDELFLVFEALLFTSSEYESRIVFLKSEQLQLKKKETSLNSEVGEVKNIHLASISNKDLELDEYRKQIENITLTNKEANGELKKAISEYEKMTNSTEKIVEQNEQLQNLLKNNDEEIMTDCIKLNNVLDTNEKINKKIQNQNTELVVFEGEISQKKADFEKLKATADETTQRMAEITAELTVIEQQLSDKQEESTKLLEETQNGNIKVSEQVEELKQDTKRKDDIIMKEQNDNEALQQQIERKQLESKEKIKNAARLSKQCQLAGHEEQKEQLNIRIDNLNKELSNEKLKQKQANEKKSAAEAKEKEKYENQLKKLQSNYDDLRNKLSAKQTENEELMSELKKAEALIVAKNTEQETILTNPTLKPIMKSPLKKNLSKLQKVQFNLGSVSDVNRSSSVALMDQTTHSYNPSSQANRLDSLKTQIPTTAEEPDTTSTIIDQIQPSQAPQSSQPRKFFKVSRRETKLTSRFGRK